MPAFKDKTHVVRAHAGVGIGGGRAEPQPPKQYPNHGDTPPSPSLPLLLARAAGLSDRRCWEVWEGFTQGTVPSMPRMATDLSSC